MAQSVTVRTQLGASLTTVVETEQTLSVDLDLRTSYGAQIEVVINSDQATPVDAVIVRMRLSMDDDTDHYSGDPWEERTTPVPPNTNDFSYIFNLPGGLWFVRFGFLSAGPTDTYAVDVFEGQIDGL